MIDGDKNHVNKLKNRFLVLNGYEVEGEYDHVFNEAYQVAYSLRVLIRSVASFHILLLPNLVSSNIPGFTVELGGKTLPYQDGSELITAMEKISSLRRQRANSEDEEEVPEDLPSESKAGGNKKRKHKRSRK